MTAIREQVCAGIEAALVATGIVEVEWMPSGDPASFPALHIFDDGQGDEVDQETDATRYRLRLGLMGFVAGGGGSSARIALNELYAQTVAAIMTFADNSSFVEVAEEGAMQVQVAALSSERRLAFSLDFDLVYATRRGDPTTL